ncbi:ASCH domain-containing protein [Streptomyces sp. NBC_00264]|uniref:ASCH domain-containing protein n=1 Tax=unclassified Streptomyces TaxID=2593676 RepID=UPI0022564126|nr:MULTISPECIES: ASCH domain-containing protein [unclassified Streptomyces]MCX5162910.1 ASCH domain-containing protein [Streptomyces sp. NBC_00305]MCX5221427.1 ASCH domain-containing protein [Streptomyces sp. NBC_00264]
MTDRTARVRELNLYRQYFELVAAGTKTIEVRVKYPHTDETCDVEVLRVTEYPDFEALLDDEGPSNVNPAASRDQQLTNIRAIYGPEKEALGALSIEMKRMA